MGEIKNRVIAQTEAERGVTADEACASLLRGSLWWLGLAVVAWLGWWWVFVIVAAVMLLLMLWLSSR